MQLNKSNKYHLNHKLFEKGKKGLFKSMSMIKDNGRKTKLKP